MVVEMKIGFLLLKQDDKFTSPLATLFYSRYNDIEAVKELINAESDKIQCVISSAPLKVNDEIVAFGQSQQPKLWDYADGIDTMEFLANL